MGPTVGDLGELAAGFLDGDDVFDLFGEADDGIGLQD